MNNNSTNILGSATIDGTPMSILEYRPINLLPIEMTQNHIINSLTIYLKDQNGNSLDFTLGGLITKQYWSMKLRID